MLQTRKPTDSTVSISTFLRSNFMKFSGFQRYKEKRKRFIYVLLGVDLLLYYNFLLLDIPLIICGKNTFFFIKQEIILKKFFEFVVFVI